MSGYSQKTITPLVTKGEKEVEDYFQSKGLACQKIPAKDKKTPDFEVTTHAGKVLIEVKDMEMGDGEREMVKDYQDIYSDDVFVIDRARMKKASLKLSKDNPFKRVRNKVHKGQQKFETNPTQIPRIVLLTKQSMSWGTEPPLIEHALYGNSGLFNRDEYDCVSAVAILDNNFQPNYHLFSAEYQKYKKPEMTGIEALELVQQIGEDWHHERAPRLRVYLNPNAQITLPVSAFQYSFNEFAWFDSDGNLEGFSVPR